MNIIRSPKGDVSKTKVGALLFGLAAAAVTLVNAISGSFSIPATIVALAKEVGIWLIALGVRDLPVLNK